MLSGTEGITVSTLFSPRGFCRSLRRVRALISLNTLPRVGRHHGIQAEPVPQLASHQCRRNGRSLDPMVAL